MKPSDLRDIEQAMTAGPWQWNDKYKDIHAPDRMEDSGYGPESARVAIVETDDGHYPPYGGDRIGIPAIRNAAPLLIELWDAVKVWVDSSAEGSPRIHDALDKLEAL